MPACLSTKFNIEIHAKFHIVTVFNHVRHVFNIIIYFNSIAHGVSMIGSMNFFTWLNKIFSG